MNTSLSLRVGVALAAIVCLFSTSTTLHAQYEVCEETSEIVETLRGIIALPIFTRAANGAAEAVFEWNAKQYILWFWKKNPRYPELPSKVRIYCRHDAHSFFIKHIADIVIIDGDSEQARDLLMAGHIEAFDELRGFLRHSTFRK